MLDDLHLDRQLRLGLDALRFTAATEVQRRAIPAALQGADLLVSAGTGSGKTLAYLVPLAQKILASKSREQPGTLALVLVPTRELARQVVKECGRLLSLSPLQVQAITGGVDFRYQKSRLRQDPEIVVATPGRMLEHLQQHSADLSALQTLVLDEADRMLDLQLREEVLAIVAACTARPQVLLLSATLSHPGVSALAGTLLQAPRDIVVGSQRRVPSGITHQLILADSQVHKDRLLSALLLAGDIRRALVFGNTRKTAARLARLLKGEHLACDCLHGDMGTAERRTAINRLREGKVAILCASDVAARGLDVKEIDAVINYDVPRSGVDYVHRAGRTGRAGARGLAITLAGAAEWARVTGIERYLQTPLERRALPGLKARYAGGADAPAGDRDGGSAGADSRRSGARGGGHRPQRRSPGDAPKSRNDGFAPLKRRGPEK